MGRVGFLEGHGFHEARDYYLVHDGLLYDSKAIAGVAYGFQHPERGALRGADFSGGMDTVVPVLRALGFNVVNHTIQGSPTGAGTLTVDDERVRRIEMWAAIRAETAPE